MTNEELFDLVGRSLFADLAFLDETGHPTVRRVFCTWHQGLGRHLISTNTSSRHVAALRRDSRASLYFADGETFEGLCLKGAALVREDPAAKELLWHEGDEKYYPLGVGDPDYCVIEFQADSARYYRFDGTGGLTREELESFDRGRPLTDRYDVLAKGAENP